MENSLDFEYLMWEIIKEGSIIRNRDEWGAEHIIGRYIDQKRRCKTCGKTELDTQVAYAGKIKMIFKFLEIYC